MNTRNSQRGYINIPSGVLETLGALAVVGALAIIGFAGWGLWWLVTHVRFVA
jgi:hypothetical protein